MLAMMSSEPPLDRQHFEENRLRAKAAFLEQQRIAAPSRSASVVAGRKRPLEVTPADSTSPTAPSSRHFVSTNDATAIASSAFPRAVTPAGKGIAGRSASALRAASAGPSSSTRGLGISDVGPTRTYVDYDLSTLKNSKGGFLVAEEEDDARELKQRQQVEELRLQRVRELERKGANADEPVLTADRNAHARCELCGSVELDFQIHRVFGVPVCPKCKHDNPEKYSLLTKTECKEDYLLTDPELRDSELLPHILVRVCDCKTEMSVVLTRNKKRNPHGNYSNMMLFLRKQVEAFAFSDKKWGSAEALDEEFGRREADKQRKKGKKFEAKLAELRRKTKTNNWHRRRDEEHVHDFGASDAVVRDADGTSKQICRTCGFEVEIEVF